ncbi:MAG TPA: anti-sigma factor, partial [Candidatus Deferrimicrobium sp.]|nr:anti-sigma factor [Candidatus Deferrimicrobium sp.]
MDCRDIRETISACVDGEASPEEAAWVREHLASCEGCRVLEGQMRAVGAGVRQVRGKVPDRFREEVFARLESEGALPKRKKVFPTAWRWAAVPLAAAAALGF